MITKKLELTSPIEFDEAETEQITAPSGSDFTLEAASGQDVIIKLGDAAGSNVLNVKTSAGTSKVTVNSSGVVEIPVLNVPRINDTDTDTLKIGGLVSTRNAADNSMYTPVADSDGAERGMKICFAPALNGGGYFESAFINTKVAASMAGTVRASEHKVSITGTANASGEAVAVYAKVNVETGATVASAVGVDVELDPEGSATVTAATGIRVNGDAKMTTMLDVSDYNKATNSAIKLPNVDGNAAVNIAALESAFGTDNNKEGIIGLYQDNADAVWLVVGNSRVGKYYKIQTAIVDS